MSKKYKLGYVLPVGPPMWTILCGVNGIPEWEGMAYVNKETNQIHKGWFHCGCCGEDGLASTKNPLCTGCSNKLLHGHNEQSPKSVKEIQDYCNWVEKQYA